MLRVPMRMVKSPCIQGLFVIELANPGAVGSLQEIGMNVSKDKLVALIEPIVTAMGLELWGVEANFRGKSSVLRIYIDSENGVDVGDCERVSRQLSLVLDVEDPVPGEYTLEVSSPGSDRTLYSLDQYEKFVGEMVDLRLRFPREGRRKFKGKLTGVAADAIAMAVDNEMYLLPFEDVEKANIVPHGDD
jgi:ribosome maturation factor RimP